MNKTNILINLYKDNSISVSSLKKINVIKNGIKPCAETSKNLRTVSI